MLSSPLFCRVLSWVLAAASGACLVLAVLGRPASWPFWDHFLPLVFWHFLLLYFPSTPKRQRAEKFFHRYCSVLFVAALIICPIYIAFSTPDWIGMNVLFGLLFIPMFLLQFYSGCLLPWENTAEQ